ncbi:MAG: LLM class flavin-dependent oxidoreductase [Mesorhizobium sp.]
MAVRLLGMIGVTPPAGSSLHIIRGSMSKEYLTEFVRAHEDSGFDSVLVGYYAASAEGFNVALYSAMQTKRISFLIAHRPGFVAPSLAARKIATFDQLTEGRMQVHIIAGTSDKEQQAEGDFLAKDDRYRRASEYLDVLRRMWTNNEPFDFDGEFYKLRGAYSDVRPFQQPYPPLYFGGSSAPALEMGARHCDVFAIYGEPLADMQGRMDGYRAMTAVHGRQAKFNASFRPIIAKTEGEAWDRAKSILADIEQSTKLLVPQNESAQRLYDMSHRGDVFDDRLWMGIARATGAAGNTTCLVGTPDQVAQSIAKYYRMGVESFLLRGFDPLNDAREFGRELVPLVKEHCAAIDREKTAA